jgi:hypothetical protein
MGTELAPWTPSALPGLTAHQRNFVLLVALGASEAEAVKLLKLAPSTRYSWAKKNPAFTMALERAKAAALSPEERAGALVAYLAAHTPEVISQVVEMAAKPWDELTPAQQRTKRWAIDLYLTLGGVPTKITETRKRFSLEDYLKEVRDHVRG